MQIKKILRLQNVQCEISAAQFQTAQLHINMSFTGGSDKM